MPAEKMFLEWFWVMNFIYTEKYGRVIKGKTVTNVNFTENLTSIICMCVCVCVCETEIWNLSSMKH